MGTNTLSDRMLFLQILFCCIALCLSEENLDSQGKANRRNQKLFFVSTTSSTSTIVTGSYCMVSSNTAIVTCKRRKRRFLQDKSEELGLKISPDRPQDIDEDEAEAAEELETGINEKDKRQGKYLLYWLTTTSIISTTSYSETQTIASVTCTPSGWTITTCK